MDTRTSQSDQFDRALPAESISAGEILQQLSGIVRRQLPIFVFVFCGAFALGAMYLYTTPAKYTSHAILVIDSSKMRVLQQQQTPIGDVPLDTAAVETQVEVLKSDNISLAVIKDQRLTEDREFMSAGGGLVRAVIEAISGLFDSSEPASEAALNRKALAIFKSQRNVTRVGRTYVLDIAYTALTPAHAAASANALADAYIVDQLESKYQATRRASAWLQDRIKELRAQASVADLAVIEYKEKNKIVDVGGSSAIGGAGARLLGDQGLAELNTQLGVSRAATAEARAKLERIQDVIKLGVPDAAVTDSLKNDVINRLRNQYLDLSARQAIWSARYGENHLAVINLRTQMTEIGRSIRDELGRIAESYKSDFEIAKARQESFEQNFVNLVSAAQATNRDRLGLRDLESNAQVYHTIYENFLQRYMEAIQQQSFPITEARVISAASPPTQKSSPLATIVFAIAGALGIVISLATAGLREAMDRVIRTSRQVEEVLGTSCIAVLPLLQSASSIIPGADGRAKGAPPRDKAEGTKRISSPHREFMRHVIDEPLSAFAEAFRSIKVAADINGTLRESKVIGVTSTVAREGKTMVSSNLAQLIAHAGKRVILVDADLRNPTLTRNLAPKASTGILEVLGSKLTLQEALLRDDATRLEFLPAVIETRLAHTNEILASESFKRLLASLRESYDYVIVDLPPIAPVVDVRTTAPVIDSYVFVVEWGHTHISLIQHKLAGAPEIYDRMLGVVLNKANINVLERYEYYYGYRNRYYARYGYTEN